MSTLALDTSNILEFDFSGEVIMSLIAMLIICILAVIIFFVFRKKDPTKPDRGFTMIVETAIGKLENFVVETMGRKYKGFTGYVLALSLYIFLCFLLGITGLPNALTSLQVPLSIGLCTFVMIHAAAIKKNKWKYYKRYTSPFAVFLPINLVSMWAPLLSITLRLFGNALSGYVIMSILYYYLGALSDLIFGSFVYEGLSSIWLSPLITPWFHLYFDLFAGVIQTLVFVVLTMIWISQEDPDESIEESVTLKEELA
ncbi:MAG: FoF1 ATP synthase subunit a [Bacilli bacterium]